MSTLKNIFYLALCVIHATVLKSFACSLLNEHINSWHACYKSIKYVSNINLFWEYVVALIRAFGFLVFPSFKPNATFHHFTSDITAFIILRMKILLA